MDPKEQIISEADHLFCCQGVKRVTMDAIAKRLGMSKKTIYQHFSDKNALVAELMAKKMQGQVCVMDHCIIEATDAVHEVFHGVTQMQELLSKINPVLFYDLQKYHPDAWKYYLTFKNEKLFSVISNNLKRGIQEGNYRSEMNTDILTWMRIGQIDSVFGQMSYPWDQFNISRIFTEITEHYLYGICTAQGSRLIKKYIKASND